MSMYRWKNGRKELLLNDDAGFKVGEIRGEPGTAVPRLDLRFTVFLTATAPAGSGLTEAQRLALLRSISLDVKYLNIDNTAEHPYQSIPLDELRNAAARLLELEVLGWAASDGLTKPIVAGANQLQFTLPISLGKVEFIPETETWGPGPAQLRTFEITVKAGSEPLAAVSSNNLAVTKYVVEFLPWNAQVNGEQWATVPHIRRFADSDREDFLLPDGLYLEVSDYGKPLATTDFSTIEVRVGDETVTTDQARPADVQATYEARPGLGAVERDLKLRTTPLYLVPYTRLADCRTGPVYVRQVVKSASFEMRAIFFPVIAEERITQAIKAVAKASLNEGQTLHAVSVARLDEALRGLEARHLPFVPWRGFTLDERQAHVYPGRRATRTSEGAEVYLPQNDLVNAASLYLAAENERGGPNAGVQMHVLRLLSDALPGAYRGGRGARSGETRVYRSVRETVLATVDAARRA